ncbi:MAG: hypothetical protein HY687_01705 [Chloroflexi bacterium]|nr:hypothetical protein [Chloroflexota bacterium]
MKRQGARMPAAPGALRMKRATTCLALILGLALALVAACGESRPALTPTPPQPAEEAVLERVEQALKGGILEKVNLSLSPLDESAVPPVGQVDLAVPSVPLPSLDAKLDIKVQTPPLKISAPTVSSFSLMPTGGGF